MQDAKQNPSTTVVLALIAALWTAFTTNWQAVGSFNDSINLIVAKKFPSGEEIPKERQLRMLCDVTANAVIFAVVNVGFGLTIFTLPLLVNKEDRKNHLSWLCRCWGSFFLLAAVGTLGSFIFLEYPELRDMVNKR